METLRATDPHALRILMTDDLYLLRNEPVAVPVASPEVPAAAPVVAESKPDFRFMGQNNRFLLLLVDEPGHEHASPTTIASLGKILGGKGYSFDDVALLNAAVHPPLEFAALKDFFACSYLVLFGAKPETVGLPALPFNTVSPHRGTKVLPTFGFAEMDDDVQKKKAFWNEMKKIEQ
jgi:hypothetical protein